VERLNDSKTKPVFRWAGGKGWLAKHLRTLKIPVFKRYHEPFFGGGAVYFQLGNKNPTYLSDINAELMNAYIQIRDNLDDVFEILMKYKGSEDEYYRVRKIAASNDIKRAAKFIYLNRTGFNGVYRGQYNVPYGHKKYKLLFEYDHYKSVSVRLSNTNLFSCDFFDTISNIQKKDLVFIDPPYTVTHIKNGFIKYNEKLFSWTDQLRLFNYIKEIVGRGAYYILSNAKHDSVLDLFGKINLPMDISRPSTIGGLNAKRGIYPEYLFTNITRGKQ
jgi:DNA adenine methylase